MNYMGLTNTPVGDIIPYRSLQVCGYLGFFPLSGVSQAQLGNRKSLRFLSFSYFDLTI